MISQVISDVITSLGSPHTPQLLFIVLFLLLLVLLLWRLWAFTVVPALYPDDPKEFPYWMPGMSNPNQSKLMT